MRVAGDQALDPLKLRPVGQVRRFNRNIDAMLLPKPRRQHFQALEVTRHQNKIMPALRKPLRVNRADPGGGPCNQDGVFGAHG